MLSVYLKNIDKDEWHADRTCKAVLDCLYITAQASYSIPVHVHHVLPYLNHGGDGRLKVLPQAKTLT